MTLNQEASEEANKKDSSFSILALYYFLKEPLKDDQEVKNLRDEIEVFLRSCLVRGNILIAIEGINGTICFPREHTNTVQDFLLNKFPKLQTRLAHHHENVFFRLRVRIKSEIVTLGVPFINVNEQVGTYVDPQDWDELIQDPRTLVIDTRNDYEVQVGTFRNALNPHTQSFVEFPEWMDRQIESLQQEKKGDDGVEEGGKPEYKKLALFCTGGIRCEKATNYCLNRLQEKNMTDIEVFHLKGGILAYLDRQVPQEEGDGGPNDSTNDNNQSTFDGECYVFDRRTAVGPKLVPTSTYTICHACRQPLTVEDRQRAEYQHGVCCHVCCQDPGRIERRQRYKARQEQFELFDKKKEGIAGTYLHDGKYDRNR